MHAMACVPQRACRRVQWALHAFGIIFNNFSAHADGESARGWIESEGGVGKVLVRRIVRYLQIDTGPQHSPSACSEALKKNQGSVHALVYEWHACV